MLYSVLLLIGSFWLARASEYCYWNHHGDRYMVYCDHGCCDSYAYSDPCCSRLSAGAIAGIVLGVTVFIIIISLIVFFVVRRNRSHTEIVYTTPPPQPRHDFTTNYQEAYHYNFNPPPPYQDKPTAPSYNTF